MKRRHTSLSAAFVLCCCLLMAVSTVHPSSLVVRADQQLAFADMLFDKGHYRRSAEEYTRFLFFFPEDVRARWVRFKAGQAFFQAGDGTAALQQLDALIDPEALDSVAVEAWLLMAECHLMRNNPRQAVVQLNHLILLSEDQTVKDRALLRIGWIHIEQLDWTGARDAFARISRQGRRHHRVEQLESALDRTHRLPRKNPVLAGTLSLLPGAGQLYTGRYQDALSAFIVNVGLFWAAYESFDADLNALGGLLLVTGIGFYTGNIYGAVTSAHKHNLAQETHFVNQLKSGVMGGIDPHPLPWQRASAGGFGLQFTFKF